MFSWPYFWWNPSKTPRLAKSCLCQTIYCLVASQVWMPRFKWSCPDTKWRNGRQRWLTSKILNCLLTQVDAWKLRKRAGSSRDTLSVSRVTTGHAAALPASSGACTNRLGWSSSSTCPKSFSAMALCLGAGISQLSAPFHVAGRLDGLYLYDLKNCIHSCWATNCTCRNTEHSSHRVHLPGNSAASAGLPPTNLVASGNAGDQVQTQNDEMPKQSKTLDNSSIWEFCKQFFDLESGKTGLLPLLTPAFQFSRLGTAGGQPCASTTNLQNSSSLVSKYPQSIQVYLWCILSPFWESRSLPCFSCQFLHQRRA